MNPVEKSEDLVRRLKEYNKSVLMKSANADLVHRVGYPLPGVEGATLVSDQERAYQMEAAGLIGAPQRGC